MFQSGPNFCELRQMTLVLDWVCRKASVSISTVLRNVRINHYLRVCILELYGLIIFLHVCILEIIY